MQVQLATLAKLLQENVAEIKFARRNPKPGQPPARRMLCTNSTNLLYSVKGKMALNFRGTSNPPEYNPARHNLHITWDILMQDYRSISMDRCNLVALLPADDTFWNYFTENIHPMSSNEKMRFMNT